MFAIVAKKRNLLWGKSAEDLYLLAEKDNTLVVSPKSESLWRMSYFLIYRWNTIPLISHVGSCSYGREELLLLERNGV